MSNETETTGGTVAPTGERWVGRLLRSSLRTVAVVDFPALNVGVEIEWPMKRDPKEREWQGWANDRYARYRREQGQAKRKSEPKRRGRG